MALIFVGLLCDPAENSYPQGQPAARRSSDPERQTRHQHQSSSPVLLTEPAAGVYNENRHKRWLLPPGETEI